MCQTATNGAIPRKSENEILEVFKKINNAEQETDPTFNDNDAEIEVCFLAPCAFAPFCFCVFVQPAT